MYLPQDHRNGWWAVGAGPAGLAAPPLVVYDQLSTASNGAMNKGEWH